jgi:hypothetical protein
MSEFRHVARTFHHRAITLHPLYSTLHVVVPDESALERQQENDSNWSTPTTRSLLPGCKPASIRLLDSCQNRENQILHHRFQSSFLVSQRHHAGSAFHYKSITISPDEPKTPSTVQAMNDERRTDKCAL